LVDFDYKYCSDNKSLNNNEFINKKQLKYLLKRNYKISNKFICLIIKRKRNEAVNFLKIIIQYYTFNNNLVLQFLINNYKNKKPLSQTDLDNILIANNKDLNDILDFDKSVDLEYKRSRSLYKTNDMYVRDTPLNVACLYDCINVVKFLIEHGADINKGEYKRYYIQPLSLYEEEKIPLITAIKTINISIIKYLIKHGADVNINCYVSECIEYCCHSYKTPLIFAIENIDNGIYCESFDLVEYLIEQGADVNYFNTSISCNMEDEDYSPLTIAKVIGYTPTIECLIKHGAVDSDNTIRK